MNAMKIVQRVQSTIVSFTTNGGLFDGIAPLVARLTLGVVFAGTGWGKLQHLDKVTAFFTELGLPAPHFQATLVGTTELVGGVLLVLGLAARFVSVPLLVTMVVALLTAKRADIHGFNDLFGTVEWTYLVMLGWVALAGPGRFSLDSPRGSLPQERPRHADVAGRHGGVATVSSSAHWRRTRARHSS